MSLLFEWLSLPTGRLFLFNAELVTFLTVFLLRVVGIRRVAHGRTGVAHTRIHTYEGNEMLIWWSFDGYLTIYLIGIGNWVAYGKNFAYIWRKRGVTISENCHKKGLKSLSGNFSNVKIAFWNPWFSYKSEKSFGKDLTNFISCISLQQIYKLKHQIFNSYGKHTKSKHRRST